MGLTRRNLVGGACLGFWASLLFLGQVQVASARLNPFEQQVREAVRLQWRWEAGDTQVLSPQWKVNKGDLAALYKPFWPNKRHLPIQVTLKEFWDCDPKLNQHQKWLRFDLEIGFSDLLPSFEVQDVLLYCDGHLNLGKEGKLRYRHPDSTPFPLGASGLALYGYEISFYPHKNRISLMTDISTFPGDPRLLRLRGKVSVTLPLKKIEFAGKLLVGDMVMGTITDAEISAESVKGTLTLLGETNFLPLDWLYQTRMRFQLDRHGFMATGDATLLRTLHKRMELAVGWNGQSEFHSHNSFQFLGLKSQLNFLVRFEPGFGKSWLKVGINAGG